MVAMSLINSQPKVICSAEKRLRHELRRHRNKQGMLMTAKLSHNQIHKLRGVLGGLSDSFPEGVNYKAIVVDTGASRSCSAFREDFESGSLVKLDHPYKLNGIAGSCAEATHKGILTYEFIGDDEFIVKLRTEGLLMKNLGCRLFSPQSHFAQKVKMAETENDKRKYSMEVFYDSVILKFAGQSSLTIPYDPVSFLPIMQGFASVKDSSDLLALLGGVTAEKNQNLTFLMKLLLQWYIRLGCINFLVVKWIRRQGWLGKMCETMGKHSVRIPKCAACQYGKQERNTKEGSKQVKFEEREGILKKNKLEPGDLVFTDQFESRIPGMVFSDRGTKVTVHTYKGGTLFVDAATCRIKAFCQSSFTAEETIQSKLTFEKQSYGEGVTIKAYSSINGVYQAKDFMNELLKKGQGIKCSGVGGHHHNGVAENAIKNVTKIARTMMINAALR